MSRYLHFPSFEGGQNSADAPTSIQDNQLVAARNIDFYRATGARKRGGATAMSLTSGPSVEVAYLFRHVPGSDETAAELWAFGDTGPIEKRRYSGGAWSLPSGGSAGLGGVGDAFEICCATLNAKMFIACTHSNDRLYVWDGSTIRNAGLPTPAAATVANTGAGAYAATARWYWVIWTVQSGGITTFRSPESAVVTFTPSGAGTAARVTRPTAPTGDDSRVTHWELYGSATSSFGAAVLLGTTAIATTTFDDSTAPGSYTGDAPPVTGTNTVQKPYKFILADGNRLLGLGDHTAGGKQSRVEFTVVLGTSGVGDDERVPQTTTQKNYVDLDENDSGGGTGMGGPLFGNIYVFKYRQTWKLKPTGIDVKPYDKQPLTKKLGCIHHRTIVEAEDKDGNPALYWLSHRGPMRATINGLERLWRPIKDTWETVNLGATNIVGHGIYHTDKGQIWWYVATGSANYPDTKIVYDVEKEAFSIHDGTSADAFCSVMFANTLGATVSRDLKPYIGRGGAVKILKCDTSDTSDDSDAFKAFITLKPLDAAGHGFKTDLENVYVQAKVATGVTLTATITRDHGIESITPTVLLTASGSETRVVKRIENAQFSGCQHVGITIGDASATANSWTLDGLTVQLGQQEPA
jgi:hypothetical protein